MTCNFKMSDREELKAVEQEIKALKANTLFKQLKKKEKRTFEEQVDLEDFLVDLAKLEAKEKYWQDLIMKASASSVSVQGICD